MPSCCSESVGINTDIVNRSGHCSGLRYSRYLLGCSGVRFSLEPSRFDPWSRVGQSPNSGHSAAIRTSRRIAKYKISKKPPSPRSNIPLYPYEFFWLFAFAMISFCFLLMLLGLAWDLSVFLDAILPYLSSMHLMTHEINEYWVYNAYWLLLSGCFFRISGAVYSSTCA